MFDLPEEAGKNFTLSADVPSLSERWQIGAIVGDSGAGKTSIARAVFGEEALQSPSWDGRRAVIDQLGDQPIEEIIRVLTSVGLGSAPPWLRPFHLLSVGEQFRAQFARQILSGKPLLVCDEFTSALDRKLARNLCISLARYLRKSHRAMRLVAVTSHRDVLSWLAPDWALDMNDRSLTWRSLRRPPLHLQVRGCSRTLWPRFARHHYLSGSLSCAVKCYAAFEEQIPVAFCAVLSHLGRPEIHRITRLVVLPEYQGLGVGRNLLERVAAAEFSDCYRVRITTSHPAMVQVLSRSPIWRSEGRRFVSDPPRQIGNCPLRTSHGRLTATFEYSPPTATVATSHESPSPPPPRHQLKTRVFPQTTPQTERPSLGFCYSNACTWTSIARSPQTSTLFR